MTRQGSNDCFWVHDFLDMDWMLGAVLRSLTPEKSRIAELLENQTAHAYAHGSLSDAGAAAGYWNDCLGPFLRCRFSFVPGLPRPEDRQPAGLFSADPNTPLGAAVVRGMKKIGEAPDFAGELLSCRVTGEGDLTASWRDRDGEHFRRWCFSAAEYRKAEPGKE